MMQIHIDAIQKSRVAETQYVLSKSLDMVCISNEKQLLEYLKDGWEIVGKYHNGVGEYNYKVSSKNDVDFNIFVIDSIKGFIEKELLGFEIKPATAVTISFQEFFAPVTCQSEEVRAFITFYNTVDGKLEHEDFRFNTENAKRIRDIISVLHMKQDKATVIDLIEKKMKMEREGK